MVLIPVLFLASSCYLVVICFCHFHPQNNVTLKLRSINTTMPDSSTTPTMQPLQPSSTTPTMQPMQPSSPHGFEDPTYLDSDAHPTARGPSSHYFQNNSETPEESPYMETYEHLSRDDSRNKSHKYAHMEAMSPTPSSPDTEHSYFVLEKSTA